MWSRFFYGFPISYSLELRKAFMKTRRPSKLLMFLSISILSSYTFAHSGASATKTDSVPADQSLPWLENGNIRYREQKLRKDGQAPKDIQRLANGQQPHAIVLSCSDSRVPPEVIFDQKLGEIFVVRTAGETLGDNVIGSIEYAVEHLGSQLIVVMGHTSCGAVKAAMGSLNGTSLGTPALDGLVKDIHPRLASYKGKNPSVNFENESWSNAEGVAQDLVKRSELLATKVKNGSLKVVPSLYDLHTGKVTFKP
jgi:carbonic anhydrase